MIHYHTTDGAHFDAPNAAELMRQLRLASWNPEGCDSAYRLVTARAATLQTGQPHRADTAENLVADLIHSGLIRTTGEEISHA